MSSILIRGPCARKLRESEKVKDSPPKRTPSVCGTSPLKPTPGVGEERVRSPQARMGKMPPSSTGVRQLLIVLLLYTQGTFIRIIHQGFLLVLSSLLTC